MRPMIDRGLAASVSVAWERGVIVTIHALRDGMQATLVITLALVTFLPCVMSTVVELIERRSIRRSEKERRMATRTIERSWIATTSTS